MLILILLLITPALANSGEKVLTVYFCGTGITHEWVDPDISGFHSAELLSFLYQNDLSSGMELTIDQLDAAYYKKIINGIATPALEPPALHHNFYDPAKWLEGVDNRRWDECLNEATEAIELLLDDQEETLELNLVGHGRGGVLCMLLARHIEDQQMTQITRINILAIDPLAGYSDGDPIKQLSDNYGELSLPANVNQYVGLYSQDERSFRYEPLIPALSAPEQIRTLMVSFPGSHETLVGSKMDNGHSLVNGQPNASYTIVDELGVVSELTALFAYQLLTSPEWGSVPMSTQASTQYENIDEAAFNQHVEDMNNNLDYWLMHTLSFGEFYSSYDHDHYLDPAHVGHELLVPADTGSVHYRLCYEAPHRETDNAENPDRVFFMDKKITPLVDGSMVWNMLQSLRGDLSSPIPIYPELPDIVEQCSVDTVEAPIAYDAVDGIIMGTTEDSLRYTEQGTYTITWHFTDATGNTLTQEQTVIVKDTIAPVPEMEVLPVLRAQCEITDIEYPVAYDNCIGMITGITDDPLYYPDEGEYNILWVYDDGHGNITEQNQTVIVKDTIPPTIVLTYDQPIEMWPANHKYETFKLEKLIESVSDNCTELNIDDVVIHSVMSDEADNGNGDGNTENDVVIADDCRSVQLRKERSGGGNGRVYSICIGVSDESDNMATDTITVVVPHDKNSGATDDGPSYTIDSKCAGYPDEYEDGDARNKLSPNFPNPFDVSTNIPVLISDTGNVKIAIYDLQGRLIKIVYSGVLTNGSHSFQWNGTDSGNQVVGNGTYLCTMLQNDVEIASRKIVVMR
ncbi:FlgD immunoglobulin-like domain containing protein [Carboxylicivirga sp. RSCT41]|uniref:FlgD immunoglobulin-like domain containing protein n=1 Tax=Carboxylicivirga agarovorans TaxID=3417570 RepID=UPI003D328B25